MGMMRIDLPVIYRGYEIKEDVTSYSVWRGKTKIKKFEKGVDADRKEIVYMYIDKRRKRENNKS